VKLLLVVDRFDRSTLCEQAWWMWDVASQAVAEGHRVEAVCLTGPTPEPDVPEGVTLHAREPHGVNAALARALARGPDVVHLASPGPLGPHLTEILTRLPMVVDVHAHWPLCPRGDFMWQPQFVRCDLSYPADPCAACAGYELMREMESRGRLLMRAAAVVAHAPFQAERLAVRLEREVEFVGYGVDTETFRPNPAPPTSPEALALWTSQGESKRVVFLGPPEHSRGVGALVDLVIGVLARVPDATFLVTGSDSTNPGWSDVFATELAEVGLGGKATVLNRVEPADLPGLLASCDVGIAPALWDDAGGLFALQALAAGLPIVTSGRGVLASLAAHGSGMLVSPDRPALFADRVAMLLAHPQVSRVMGEAARLHAVEHHDRGIVLAELNAIHHRVAGEPLRDAA
jgi:glycosyltransferase involved in cell wall biosynthesis